MGTYAEELEVAAPQASWQRWLRNRIASVVQQLKASHRTKSEITVVKVLSVGQKASVAILEAEGCRFLLGVTSASVTLLKVFGEDYVVRGVVK